MTPTQFETFITNLAIKTMTGQDAWKNLGFLVGRVQKTIDRTDSLSSPLSQTEVDRILSVETPLYNTLKAALLAAYNSLP